MNNYENNNRNLNELSDEMIQNGNYGNEGTSSIVYIIICILFLLIIIAFLYYLNIDVFCTSKNNTSSETCSATAEEEQNKELLKKYEDELNNCKMKVDEEINYVDSYKIKEEQDKDLIQRYENDLNNYNIKVEEEMEYVDAYKESLDSCQVALSESRNLEDKYRSEFKKIENELNEQGIGSLLNMKLF